MPGKPWMNPDYKKIVSSQKKLKKQLEKAADWLDKSNHINRDSYPYGHEPARITYLEVSVRAIIKYLEMKQEYDQIHHTTSKRLPKADSR